MNWYKASLNKNLGLYTFWDIRGNVGLKMCIYECETLVNN